MIRRRHYEGLKQSLIYGLATGGLFGIVIALVGYGSRGEDEYADYCDRS